MVWAILPYIEWVNAIREVTLSKSERTVAVLGGALLEESVERTLRERFHHDDDMANNILKPDKALGNLGPQIDVLYMLGAFDKTQRAAMKSLVFVRNFFAHDIKATFASIDKEFLRHVSRLKMHEGRKHYPNNLYGPDTDLEIEKVENNRDRFIVNLKLALIFLMRDRIGHEPYSNQPLSAEELHKKFHELREAQDRERKAWLAKQQPPPVPQQP